MTPLEGLVVAAHGRHVLLQTDDGRRLLAHPRGKRGQAVVGDRVHWLASGNEAVVEAVLPRRNLLFRQDAWRTKSFAANLDAVLVLVSADPPFSERMVARALIAAHSAGVPAWVALNKVDLDPRPGRAKLAPLVTAQVEVVELTLREREAALARLAPRLQGRTTLVMGPSGAGKSTLVNLLCPQARAEVGEVSQALHSGRHTTTATRWYALGEALGPGALIDSPGFQEFGLNQVSPADLVSHMPDVHAQLGGCRFYNCSHRQEPGCSVRAAVEQGRLAGSRWRQYVEILDELEAEATRAARA
ncbi:MAG: ribosome small subunit-dependent GTPase A [Rubrivivax sp.]